MILHSPWRRVVPGIPGKAKQISIETWKKKVPSERRYQTGCIAHVKETVSCAIFAFSWQNSGWKVSVDLGWKLFFILWSQFVHTGIWSVSNPPVFLRPHLKVRKVQSEQQQTWLHIYFLTLCFLTTRVEYVWARRLSLSVICWVDMSLCGGREMSFALRGSSFEHIMNGLFFASTLNRSNLLLDICLTLFHIYTHPNIRHSYWEDMLENFFLWILVRYVLIWMWDSLVILFCFRF